jgi:hypothetical protein
VLHVTAVLDGAEEAFQIGIGKQLRQPALFASPAQAQLLAGLLRDIEKIVVPQPGLARDLHELSHGGGFRLFIWRHEVNPLRGPFGFHSCIHGYILLRLLAIVRNRLSAPADVTTHQGQGAAHAAHEDPQQRRARGVRLAAHFQ